MKIQNFLYRMLSFPKYIYVCIYVCVCVCACVCVCVCLDMHKQNPCRSSSKEVASSGERTWETGDWARGSPTSCCIPFCALWSWYHVHILPNVSKQGTWCCSVVQNWESGVGFHSLHVSPRPHTPLCQPPVLIPGCLVPRLNKVHLSPQGCLPQASVSF